jgi:hypothetical protein
MLLIMIGEIYHVDLTEPFKGASFIDISRIVYSQFDCLLFGLQLQDRYSTYFFRSVEILPYCIYLCSLIFKVEEIAAGVAFESQQLHHSLGERI